MDPRERQNDFLEAMRMVFEAHQAEMWTALPGIIESFNPVECSASVQPTIQVKRTLPDNTVEWKTMPLLIHCPVVFPCGGGFTLTFPVKKNDECLIVWASRCIDGWWESGAVSQQPEFRMHDLSDGFVLVGPRSQVRQLVGISTDTVQLRADDGESYVELAPDGSVNILAPGGLNVTGPVNIVGPTMFTGTVMADLFPIDETHMHTGVTTGGGVTGPVSP